MFDIISHTLCIFYRVYFEPRKYRGTNDKYCYLLITADTMTSYHLSEATVPHVQYHATTNPND